MDDQTSLSDLLPLYALGVLSETESAKVEAWLAQSVQAREELRGYEAMLTGLALTVQPRKASPRLTAEFKDRLEKLAANSASSTALPTVSQTVKGLPRFRWALALAALLLVVLVSLGVYALVTAQNNAQSIQAILSDTKATRVALAPQNGGSGAVTFVRVDSQLQCVVLAELPPLPSESQYQLWLTNQNGERESSLVFDGSQTNRQWLMTVPDVNDHYVAVGITIEPRGGSKQPTTPPIFAGQLSN